MTSGVGLLPSARRRCAKRYGELGGHPVCRAPWAAWARPLLCGPQRVRGLFRLRENCFGQLRSRNTSTCGTRRFVDRNRAYRMVRSARDTSGCHIAGRNAGRPEDRGTRLTTTTWRFPYSAGAGPEQLLVRRQPAASIQMGSPRVGRTCPSVISECKNRI
jgi:hypothetical protein